MILVIDCSSSKRHKKERESRSCYFPLILYLAHGKSETRLPEVTTQVRNKPGWTNHRHLLRLLWEVQSKRDTPSRRSSQAKAPERDRHCQRKHFPVISSHLNHRVNGHFQSGRGWSLSSNKKWVRDPYPLGSPQFSFLLHPPTSVFN